MSVYYIDAEYGQNDMDGLSAQTPKKDYFDINVKAGDKVLFKRGNFIRGCLKNKSGEKGRPITYGAYGEGNNPIFCGSIDCSNPENWRCVGENIWLYMDNISAEACNFIFNNGEYCGSLKWDIAELSGQGDWYDACFGCKDQADILQHIYLKSEANPGIYYSHIECVTLKEKIAAGVGHNIIYENLSFENWMFGIAGFEGAQNITVKNCSFRFIGGGVWRKERKIRYGNAVEFWDRCENVTVEKCLFEDVYDSGVTHQGGENCSPPVNLHIEGNLFMKCGMAAYEGRDRVPINSCFNNNICIDAGCGFSKNGVIMPRNSEIWPQPMGHHIFLWRMNSRTEKGKMEIKRNIFYNTPYGASLYSIICEEASLQFELINNIYSRDDHFLARWNGVEYTSPDLLRDLEKSCRFESDETKKDQINKWMVNFQKHG